ncbi:MAG: hypothetical protein Q4B70_10185 [Lachnospiraceae bacterium]|nr:hypothetical protein [Lachnospiraceae bacterium]
MQFFDQFFMIMSYISIIAFVITGLLSIDVLNASMFYGIDIRGQESAIILKGVIDTLNVNGLFDLGGYVPSSGWEVAIFSLINAADFIVTLGIKIILYLAIIVANFMSAVNIMILPLQFIFDILGMGEFFNAIASIFSGGLTIGMIFIVIRFGIFIWKGA